MHPDVVARFSVVFKGFGAEEAELTFTVPPFQVKRYC